MTDTRDAGPERVAGPERLARLERTARAAREQLLAQRDEHGRWRGELSSSALSTATATAALALYTRVRPDRAAALRPLVERGRAWLTRHANADGGFGDTVTSPSHPATTALAWMALGVDREEDGAGAVTLAHAAAAAWLERALGGTDAAHLASGLERVYGEDRTFAVPILAACAIGGAFDDEPGAWRSVRSLPFELAALPRGLFRHVGLPVVSYALPALIAIGQAIDHHRPTRNPLLRLARDAARQRTLRVLTEIQPENGGFLEATPLTSFVVLSLVSCRLATHPVVERGVAFLEASVRADGSWPIDTDLATWLTSLATGALHAHLDEEERARLREVLLAAQLRAAHPYTGAAPGGWAWTDLPGGVPDADDTAAALLALRALEGAGAPSERVLGAAAAGVGWLADLQNRDGGVPTFCRGWGKLPFDRSAADLTAHALRAWDAWRPALPASAAGPLASALERAARHLVSTQRADGSWVPLWFGNQAAPAQENPLYGTSRVLRAAGVAVGAGQGAWRAACERGLAWLLAAQREDGGFGGAADVAPSIEETALGLEALCDARSCGLGLPGAAGGAELAEPIAAAAAWLAEATDEGRRFVSAPIGLYFARLWYAERLYPVVFGVSALERARVALHG